jgi:hypothetical protein
VYYIQFVQVQVPQAPAPGQAEEELKRQRDAETKAFIAKYADQGDPGMM